jgi:CRP/FNR family transcriptional regulator, anaerobic regulatory protein
MVKLDEGGPTVSKGPCAYCVVRQIGMCRAYGEGEGLDLSHLEAAHLPVRIYEAGDIIYRQGELSDYIFNVISGWVDLHQDMADGRRQISQFLFSGSVFGLKPKGVMFAHGATAITAASICAIPTARVDDLRQHSPAFNEHFIWMLERENHLAVEALTIIGQGASLERVARILWSLGSRLSAPGPVSAGGTIRVPLTQRLIAEATGLTAIHVNRVVRRLREQRVVDFHDGVMVIEDPQRLAALANAYPDSAALWDDGASAARIQPQATPQEGIAQLPGRTGVRTG